MNKRIFLFILLITPMILLANSAERSEESTEMKPTSSSISPQKEQNQVAEPWGFSGILLGMSMSEVEAKLEASAYFSYDSHRVSWLPFSPLVSAKGKGLILMGYFHFVNDKLYSINLEMNPVKIDFWTLMGNFQQKYGEYDLFEPSRVMWKGVNSSISLEKPLTVTYLDAQLHEEFVSQSMIEESKEQMNRERFLEQF